MLIQKHASKQFRCCLNKENTIKGLDTTNTFSLSISFVTCLGSSAQYSLLSIKSKCKNHCFSLALLSIYGTTYPVKELVFYIYIFFKYPKHRKMKTSRTFRYIHTKTINIDAQIIIDKY